MTSEIPTSWCRPLTDRLVRRVLFPALLLLGSSVSLPWALAAAENDTRISLGAVSGLPKGEVMVPLFLTPSPSSLQVGNIAVTIRFENKAVSFLKAEKGFLLDGVDAGFEARVQQVPGDPNQSVIHLEVATKGEPRKALREGLILTLVFRIAEGASAGTVVNLDFEKLSASDLSAPPKPVDSLSGQKGTIEVIPLEQAPYIACFFFTH